MKNITKESPASSKSARTDFSRSWVDAVDIKSKDLLDIGCGFGWFEVYAVDKGATSIIGTEIGESDLEAARNSGIGPKAKFEVASAIDLPHQDGQFDTVVSWEVIEHIPRGTEPKMFSEVARVLKPGGTFYLSTPYMHALSTPLDPAWWLIGHRHYSLQKLTKFAITNGFVIEDFHLKGQIFSLLSSLNMYFSKWVLRRKRIANDWFMTKEHQEYEQPTGYANIFVKFRKI